MLSSRLHLSIPRNPQIRLGKISDAFLLFPVSSHTQLITARYSNQLGDLSRDMLHPILGPHIFVSRLSTPECIKKVRTKYYSPVNVSAAVKVCWGLALQFIPLKYLKIRPRILENYSKTSKHFMEPVGSLPCSQEPSTGP
jgi:hypothetical protein